MRARGFGSLAAFAWGVVGGVGCMLPEAGPAAKTATCHDGIHNGDETGPDCGGGCGPCPVGASCRTFRDCDSKVCDHNVCRLEDSVPQGCWNAVRDGSESDVDCGGECAACPGGSRCIFDIDCRSGVCEAGRCGIEACGNGGLDPGETDVDCGGPTCSPCDQGRRCLQWSDCRSQYCDPGSLQCEVPLCENGVLDPGEIDVDCGGTCRTLCGDGQTCVDDGSCRPDLSCRGGICFSRRTPFFGVAAVEAMVPPPPIAGGTLRVLSDGVTAVAADPDRDTIWVVDLAGRALVAQLALAAGDEPGRVVEDGAHRVHVALRRGGALVDLAPGPWRVVGRRAVCPAPRGIAWQAKGDLLHVACAGGELISLPAAGGAPTRSLRLDPDLRDVVLDGDHLLVSRFRSAELLTLDAQGHLLSRQLPPPDVLKGNGGFGPLPDMGLRPDMGPAAPDLGQPAPGLVFEPEVAWRLIARPGGGALMVHQRRVNAAIAQFAGSYTQQFGCTGMLETVVTAFTDGQAPASADPLGGAVLPVDVAPFPDGISYALVAAGNAAEADLRTVQAGPITSLGNCGNGGSWEGIGAQTQPTGQPIALAFDGQKELVVQTREPPTLQVLTGRTGTIVLPGATRVDTGHTIFHSAASRFTHACASCHPEGGDDSMTWEFAGVGKRRTQSLRGGVVAMSPFHWDGDLADFPALVHEVFEKRMIGPPLSNVQLTALSHWVDAIPALPRSAPPDPAAVARGAARFADPAVGCTVCHSGPRLSNRAVVGVGTGGTFKVPSLLGVWARAPFLHDGCAATLADRFGPCGGGDAHGHTAQLEAPQIADLAAYLGSL